MTNTYKQAQEAVDFLKKILPARPRTVIVSGSGLGDIAEIVENKIIIDSKEIPNWPRSTAPGHAGKILAGEIEGREVLFLSGRVHYYEGHSMNAVIFPTRVLALLGAKEFIATNASGAINKNFLPGDIIAVKDHLNLMGVNPLIGPHVPEFGERFPDMSHAYNPEMLKILKGLGLKQGVYIAFSGPSFETPAEIKMAGILGADLVGMSTVPEVIAANSMGMKVAVLSCVANMAAGVLPEATLSGQEVLDNMKLYSKKLADILINFIKILNKE